MSTKKCLSPEKFDIDDLVFGDEIEGEIPISVKRPDGSVGPLIMVSDTIFSFGVERETKYDTYTVSLALCDKDKPTRKQRHFVEAIRDIISACDPKPKSCFTGMRTIQLCT